MNAVVIALAALFFVACAPEGPPQFVSFDAEFSESEVETLRAAVSAWCESKAAWCPEEVLWSDRGRFELVDTLGAGEALGQKGIVAGKQSGGVIRIARDRPEGLDTLFMTAAHEIGHFCTDHTETGLMASFHKADDAVEVDEVAVDAWRAGCP